MRAIPKHPINPIVSQMLVAERPACLAGNEMGISRLLEQFTIKSQFYRRRPVNATLCAYLDNPKPVLQHRGHVGKEETQ